MKNKNFGSMTAFLKANAVENLLSNNNLNFLMQNKDILLDSYQFYKNKKNVIIKNSNVFIKTSKLIKYRRLLSTTKVTNSFLQQQENAYFFNFKIINYCLKSAELTTDYSFFVRYQQSLFSKNFNLFLDFIKVTSLLCQNLVSLKLFTHLLSNLFRLLHKRQHNRFVFFVSNLFKYILITYPNVSGLQLEISGRLLGKPRASTIKIEQGFLGLNSFCVNKHVYKTHIYTLYGAFGLKCSINFKK